MGFSSASLFPARIDWLICWCITGLAVHAVPYRHGTPCKDMGGSHPGWKLPDAEDNSGNQYHKRLGGKGGDWMVWGSWVEGLLLISFLFFPYVLHFNSYEHISCLWWSWVFHPLCPDPFHFLRSSHFPWRLFRWCWCAPTPRRRDLGICNINK